VNVDDVVYDSLSVFFRKFGVSKIELCHRDEGFLGPSEKPVDGGVRNQSREVPAPDSEGIAGGGHGKDNVEVVPCFFKEEVPKFLLSLLISVALGLIFYFISHVFLFLLVKKRGHHTDGQQVVDQLQKSFLDDMGIGEQEEHRATAEVVEKNFQILSELLFLVSSG
jgi:hypothetical protein